MYRFSSALLKSILASGVSASLLLTTIPGPAFAQSSADSSSKHPVSQPQRQSSSSTARPAAPVQHAPQYHPVQPTYVRTMPVSPPQYHPVHPTYVRTMPVSPPQYHPVHPTYVRAMPVTPRQYHPVHPVHRVVPVYRQVLHSPAIHRNIMLTTPVHRNMMVHQVLPRESLRTTARAIAPVRTPVVRGIRLVHVTVREPLRTRSLVVHSLPRVIARHVVYLPRAHTFAVYHPAYLAGRVVRIRGNVVYVRAPNGAITPIFVRYVRVPSRVIVVNRYVALPARWVNGRYVYYTGAGYNAYSYNPALNQWYTYNPNGYYSTSNPYNYSYNPYNSYPNYGYTQNPYGYPSGGNNILSTLLLGAVISYALPALLGQNGGNSSGLLGGLFSGLTSGYAGGNPYGYSQYPPNSQYAPYNAYPPNSQYAPYNAYPTYNQYAPYSPYSGYNPDASSTEDAYNPYAAYTANPVTYSPYAPQPAYAPYGTPPALAQVQGVIMAVSGSTLMILGQNGETPILINASPAINNGYTNGPLVSGRLISAYGYYQNNTNTFIASALM